LFVACGAPSDAPGGGYPPAEVGVVTIAPAPLALTTELPGRLAASRVAEVRARAAGIVLARTFDEGADVTEGQVLFRIDPGQLQATRDSAAATVARAEATVAQAKRFADRLEPLVATAGISQQDRDDAATALALAEADLAAAKAALQAARLNLAYATVTAPIAGRIGRSNVTEGALVGQAEATPLATIQQIDPMYVNLTESSADLLRQRRALADGQLQASDGGATVTVITEDGAEHPHPGRLLFTDITVDPNTGAVTLRAEVPNPEHTLLPGMFVRARLVQGVAAAAITVPQQAVTRGAAGAEVMVVGADDTVAVKQVSLGGSQGEAWIVESGLTTGDRVVVDGVQKIGPGAKVVPVPWTPLPVAGN
jgi:membrane fusion protein (multidrug efflux system)